MLLNIWKNACLLSGSYGTGGRIVPEIMTSDSRSMVKILENLGFVSDTPNHPLLRVNPICQSYVRTMESFAILVIEIHVLLVYSQFQLHWT